MVVYTTSQPAAVEWLITSRIEGPPAVEESDVGLRETASYAP
jgi:hypothetical protein